MKLLSFVFVIIISSASCTDKKPSDPLWHDTFRQEFKEDLVYPILGTDHTAGTYYYDSPTKRYRIDRQNGRYDKYCGVNGLKIFKNVACNNYVDENGDRYLHYPESNECCFCCASKNGCGALMPRWLKGAQFLGIVDYKGQKAYKWNQKGGGDNFYYETINDDPLQRVMLGLEQPPSDYMYFDKESFQNKASKDELKLPSICKKDNTCALLSVCTVVRHLY